MPREPESCTFDADPDAVFDAAVAAVTELGLKVDQIDRPSHLLTFRSGMSMDSWAGQEMSLLVLPLGSPSQVTLTSRRRGFQLYDWGEARKIATRIFDSMAARLP